MSNRCHSEKLGSVDDCVCVTFLFQIEDIPINLFGPFIRSGCTRLREFTWRLQSAPVARMVPKCLYPNASAFSFK